MILYIHFVAGYNQARVYLCTYIYDRKIVMTGYYNSRAKHIEPETKWLPFRRWHFQVHLLEWKLLNFKWNFTEICCLGYNWQYGSIVSDNGLVPNRRQPIIWRNVGMLYWHVTRPQWVNANMYFCCPVWTSYLKTLLILPNCLSPDDAYVDGLAQERLNSSVLAMELHLFFINPPKCIFYSNKKICSIFVFFVNKCSDKCYIFIVSLCERFASSGMGIQYACININCQTSNIRHTKSQNLNVSCLILQLSLPNPLKSGVVSRMKT